MTCFPHWYACLLIKLGSVHARARSDVLSQPYLFSKSSCCTAAFLLAFPPHRQTHRLEESVCHSRSPVRSPSVSRASRIAFVSISTLSLSHLLNSSRVSGRCVMSCKTSQASALLGHEQRSLPGIQTARFLQVSHAHSNGGCVVSRSV